MFPSPGISWLRTPLPQPDPHCFSQPGRGNIAGDEDEDRSWEAGGWDEAGDSKLRHGQRTMPGISVAGTRSQRSCRSRSKGCLDQITEHMGGCTREWGILLQERKNWGSSWVGGGAVDFCLKSSILCWNFPMKRNLPKILYWHYLDRKIKKKQWRCGKD